MQARSWQFPFLSLRQRSVCYALGFSLALSWSWVMFFAPSAKETWRQTMCVLPIALGYFVGQRLTAVQAFFEHHLVPAALAGFAQTQIMLRCARLVLTLLLACLTTLVDHTPAQICLLATLFALGTSIGISIGVDLKLSLSKKIFVLILQGISVLVWALLFSLDKAQGRISFVAIVSSISLGLLFAALLIRHVKIGMKSRFVIEDEGNLQWFNSIKHQLYRYSMFDSKIDYQHHSFYQHCALLMPATVSFLILYAVYLFAVVQDLHQISFTRLLFLVALCLFSSSQLVAHDWHWRYLLLPQGSRSASFSSQLWVANLIFFGTMALPLLIWKSLNAEQLGATIFPQILSFLVNSYLELASVFVAAIIIAGAQHPLRVRYYCYYTMIFGASAVYGLAYVSGQMSRLTELCANDLKYSLTLTIVCVVAAIKAKKLWTQKRIVTHFANA